MGNTKKNDAVHNSTLDDIQLADDAWGEDSLMIEDWFAAGDASDFEEMLCRLQEQPTSRLDRLNRAVQWVWGTGSD